MILNIITIKKAICVENIIRGYIKIAKLNI
jgi:hypothetical protein